MTNRLLPTAFPSWLYAMLFLCLWLPIAVSASETRVYLSQNDALTLSDGQIRVFGHAGTGKLTVTPDVRQLTVDQNIAWVRLPGHSDVFRFRQTGNRLRVHNADGAEMLAIPVQGDADGTQFEFDNGIFDAKLEGGVMTLGGSIVIVGNTAVELSPTVSSQSTVSDGNTPSQAKVFLAENASFQVNSPGTQVFGNSNDEAVTLAFGVNEVQLDQNIERVILQRSSNQYRFQQTGNVLNIFDETGEVQIVQLLVQGDADGTVIEFADRTLSAKLTEGVMTVGDNAITEPSPEPITFLISVTSGDGGNVNCTPNPVNRNGDSTCTATAGTGYSFTGWSGGCSGTEDTCTLSAVTEPLAVTAAFSNRYTVALDVQGGDTIDPNMVEVTFGSPYGTLPVPTRSGYSLSGWNTASNGTGTAITSETTVSSAENHTLYAQWTIQYTLTYYAGTNGTIDEDDALQVLNHGEDGTTVTAVPATGYYFAKWSDDVTDNPRTDTNIEDNITVTALYGRIVPLNDTGITRCGNDTSNTETCLVTDFPGQDAEHGRDAVAAADTLDKTGGGKAGFDFTKIANDGTELADDTPLGEGEKGWACTRDNHTGLIWEVKTTSGLRNMAHTYTWYEPDSSKNGGSAGTQNGGICHNKFHGTNNLNGNRCDTVGYVAAVNVAELCGASNWRMPDVNELLSIVDNSRVNPTIDTDYFPNSPSSHVWSSSPFAGDSPYACSVSFAYGQVSGYLKTGGLVGVRLVRDGQ